MNTPAQIRIRNVAGGGKHIVLWCPGCQLAHRVSVVGDDGSTEPNCPIWEWNGDPNNVTVSPSLLVQADYAIPHWGGRPTDEAGHLQCHSFIRDGQWQFLGDCTHALAGQTVPFADLPDWLAAETS